MKVPVLIKIMHVSILVLLPSIQLFAQFLGGQGSGYSSRSYSDDNIIEPCIVVLGIESSPLSGEIDENNDGRLYWHTYSERNNTGFEIQKTLNGETWETIGWINGAGNSTNILHYEYIDPNLSHDYQYYRFKQIDFDGAHSFSNTMLLSLNAPTNWEDMFVLYPNPASSIDRLKLRGWIKKPMDVQLTIYDLSGRILFSKHHIFGQGTEVFELPTYFLSSGAYYLFLHHESKPSLKIPFVITN